MILLAQQSNKNFWTGCYLLTYSSAVHIDQDRDATRCALQKDPWLPSRRGKKEYKSSMFSTQQALSSGVAAVTS